MFIYGVCVCRVYVCLNMCACALVRERVQRGQQCFFCFFFFFFFFFAFPFSLAWPLAGRVGISAHPLPSGRRHRDTHTERRKPHVSVVGIVGVDENETRQRGTCFPSAHLERPRVSFRSRKLNPLASLLQSHPFIIQTMMSLKNLKQSKNCTLVATCQIRW
jgi:hypothetical protein